MPLIMLAWVRKRLSSVCSLIGSQLFKTMGPICICKSRVVGPIGLAVSHPVCDCFKCDLCKVGADSIFTVWHSLIVFIV